MRSGVAVHHEDVGVVEAAVAAVHPLNAQDSFPMVNVWTREDTAASSMRPSTAASRWRSSLADAASVRPGSRTDRRSARVSIHERRERAEISLTLWPSKHVAGVDDGTASYYRHGDGELHGTGKRTSFRERSSGLPSVRWPWRLP